MIAQRYGVLPTQLLALDMDEFNINYYIAKRGFKEDERRKPK